MTMGQNTVFSTLVFAWATLTHSLALDGAPKPEGLTFSLTQHAIKRQRPWSPAHSVLKAHLKYNIKVPVEVEDAAAEAENNMTWLTGRDDAGEGGKTSVPAKPVRTDQMYVVDVAVGNANMSLDIDTGSSDLWVVSTLQPADQRGSRPPSRIYDPKASNGKQMEGHSWSMSYGDASTASGQVYQDKVAIGNLVVPNQAVEAAKTMSRKFIRDAGHDGLFGFGSSKRNSIRPKAQLTWWDNIRPKLAYPLFTSSLKRRAAGSFDFGYIDKSKYTGEIVYTPVSGKRGYWDFTPTGFAIGDGPVHAATFEAIADTGSSLWYLPPTIANAYWAQVPGSSYSQAQSGFVFPCNSNLPNMTVIVSGKRVTVPGIMMNYQTVAVGTCMGGINRDFGMPFSIFGDAFLKGLFVVYEAPIGGQLRLGFASQKT